MLLSSINSTTNYKYNRSGEKTKTLTEPSFKQASPHVREDVQPHESQSG